MSVPLRLVVWYALLHFPYPSKAQSNPLRPEPKAIFGAQLPIDKESIFRLPNQSQICSSFIHSYYLDWNAAPAAQTVRPDSQPTRSSGATWSAPSGWSEPSAVSQRGSRPNSYRMRGQSLGRESYYENGSGGMSTTLYTFTTPLYPANYPPQIDCIKIIRAPSKKERIVLDFRGPVVFEPSSNCDNDYLEVRDGQFGFSPLVGRFCTDSWRLRPIISTGPWLWLRLQTDHTIEKSGFQAVYYFEPNKSEQPAALSRHQHKLETVITLDAGTVLTKSNLSQLLWAYAQTLEHRPSVVSGVREFIFDFRTAEEDMLLRMHLETIKFPVEENECHHNMIEMYGRFFLSDPPKSRFGGKSYSRLQVPPESRVIRACKMASRSPIIYRLGRAIVRIVATSSVHAMREVDQREDDQKHVHLPMRENIDLPEIKLLATALTTAPCRPNWFPCLRVTDLLNIDRRLNATGDSVLNLLMRSEEEEEEYEFRGKNLNSSSREGMLHTRRQTKRRRELVGDQVYCVAISRLCNQFNDCPNGEDEDECPRPRDSLKDVLKYYAELDTTRTGDAFSTTTPTAVQSKKESEEAEDEFHHHPSIIIGLLGFCAICGLLSAGMTLVNRGKLAKQRNFSSICNRVLFDSGTSLLTTLEEGSVLQLKTRDGHSTKPQASSMQTEDDQYLDKNHTSSESAIRSPTTPADTKAKDDSDRCLSHLCPAMKKKRERTNSDPIPAPSMIASVRPDVTDATNRRAKGSCSSTEPSVSAELASRNLIEVFDRATIPLSHNSHVTAGWEESLQPSQPDELLRSRNRLRRKVQSGELVCRIPQSMSRSSAASFGHLPNTVVCPVEKLSDVVYHCGMLPPGMTLNRTTWNRSGPLPLVTEPGSDITANYLRGTLKTTRSAKCLSRRSSTDRNPNVPLDFINSGQSVDEPELDGETAMSNGAGFCTPDSRARMMFTSARPPIDTGYMFYGQPDVDATRHMDQVDSVVVERKAAGTSGKRKSFKGGAPKRARYSIDPSNEPNSMVNTTEPAMDASDFRFAENGTRTMQTPLFWTSSCSTSGELLNSGQSSREVSRGWRKSSSGTQPSLRPYWGGHMGSTKLVIGPSGTPSEDVSLADLNEDETTPKLVYRCESSSLGSHVKIGRLINTSNMDEARIPSSIRPSNKPEALFKVTVMPKGRGSQSFDLRASDSAGSGGFGAGLAQSESRRAPVPAAPAPPLQTYCDCALQSNELLYRSQPRTPHHQTGGYAPTPNPLARPKDDRRHSQAVPELDDSEDTVTHNYSEETESGTYSDDRLTNNSIKHQKENHAWRASDDQTASSDGSPDNKVKTTRALNVAKSKRSSNSTTIIITSRDGARQIYREEQL